MHILLSVIEVGKFDKSDNFDLVVFGHGHRSLLYSHNFPTFYVGTVSQNKCLLVIWVIDAQLLTDTVMISELIPKRNHIFLKTA